MKEKAVLRGFFDNIYSTSVVMSVVVSPFLRILRSCCLNTWKLAHRILKGILLNMKSAGHDCSPISH